MVTNPFLDLIAKPTAVEASDGTLWPSAGAAWYHDVLERQIAALWRDYEAELSDPQKIKESREFVCLGSRELARRIGISHGMLSHIESGRRRATRPVLERLWAAIYVEKQAQRNRVLPDVFVRIDQAFQGIVTTEERL